MNSVVFNAVLRYYNQNGIQYLKKEIDNKIINVLVVGGKYDSIRSKTMTIILNNQTNNYESNISIRVNDAKLRNNTDIYNQIYENIKNMNLGLEMVVFPDKTHQSINHIDIKQCSVMPPNIYGSSVQVIEWIKSKRDAMDTLVNSIKEDLDKMFASFNANQEHHSFYQRNTVQPAVSAFMASVIASNSESNSESTPASPVLVRSNAIYPKLTSSSLSAHQALHRELTPTHPNTIIGKSYASASAIVIDNANNSIAVDNVANVANCKMHLTRKLAKLTMDQENLVREIAKVKLELVAVEQTHNLALLKQEQDDELKQFQEQQKAKFEARKQALLTNTIAIPVAEPVAIPVAIPVALPVAIPVAILVSEPVAILVSEPVVIPVAILVSEPVAILVSEPVAILVSEQFDDSDVVSNKKKVCAQLNSINAIIDADEAAIANNEPKIATLWSDEPLEDNTNVSNLSISEPVNSVIKTETALMPITKQQPTKKKYKMVVKPSLKNNTEWVDIKRQ